MKNISPVWATVVVVVLVVVGVGVYFGYTRFIANDSDSSALTQFGIAADAEVQLVSIRRGDLVNAVSINGSLEYSNREKLKFALSGTVDSVMVEAGDSVLEGDVLMSLDSESIATAEKDLREASVALQDAEKALMNLTNPEATELESARLKLLQKQQAFEDAERRLTVLQSGGGVELETARVNVLEKQQALDDARDKLAGLASTGGIQVESARVNVLEKQQALDDARDKLAGLASTGGIQVESARVNVLEKQQALEDAQQRLDDIVANGGTELESARVNVLEKQQALDNAVKAVDDLVSQHATDLNNAKLAVLEAEQELIDARNVASSALIDAEFELAKAESERATAAVALRDAEKNLNDALDGPKQEDVDDLRLKISRAELDLEILNGQFADAEIKADASLRDTQKEFNDAYRGYLIVFSKWLGMDITDIGVLSPPDIFAVTGVNLDALFGDGIRRYDAGDIEGIRSDVPADNPNTAWDEKVVGTWLRFSPLELRLDCDRLGLASTSERGCIRKEFDDAWDLLRDKQEAHLIATTDAQSSVDGAMDALVSARDALKNLQDDLDDLLKPADAEEIADLTAKRDLAARTLIKETTELEQLKASITSSNSEESLDSETAEQKVKVAEDKLSEARSKLAELEDGVDSVYLELRSAEVNKAEADLEDAKRDLADLENDDSVDVTLISAEVNKAEADLEVAKRDLADLEDVEQDLAQAQVDKAEADLEDAKRELADLEDVEQDLAQAQVDKAEADLEDAKRELAALENSSSVDVELIVAEVNNARAEYEKAGDDLAELLNPDDATVALRRSDVAVAQDAVESARSKLAGGVITAPFDGIIASVDVKEGESAGADAEVVEIADPSVVEIDGTVDEIDILFLQVGDDASITIEAYGDEPLVGNVSEITAFGQSDQGVVTYPITIRMESPAGTQLPEGLSATAKVIFREENDVLLVPIQALFGSVDAPTVILVGEDGSYVERAVTTGISDDFWVVIESGVSEGETILMTVVGSDDFEFGGGF